MQQEMTSRDIIDDEDKVHHNLDNSEEMIWLNT